MNKQFSKMSNTQKNETYAGYKKKAPMTKFGAILSLGMAAIGGVKMIMSDRGSFRGRGFNVNWGDSTSSSSSSGSGSTKPVEQKNYYYAY